MQKESFTKRFTGNRAEKRYQNEIDAHLLFPEFTPKIIRTTEDPLEIILEKISGSDSECNDQTLKSIGIVLATIHKNHQNLGEWKKSHLTERYRLFTDERLANLFEQLSLGVLQPRYGFTHGDYRRRNILSSPDGVVVVDWEFFGINFIYWDLAIFSGDFVHQKFHGLQTNSLRPFWEGYLSENTLTDEELSICKTLGGLDIIADHILQQPGEKPPEPLELFADFSDEEKNYLLNHRNYD